MERDDNLFYDRSGLRETPGIRLRASREYLQDALGDPDIRVISVNVNESGVYKRILGNIKGLPPYVDVRLQHRTGVHWENITVWSPVAWNDRFMGTGGGGTGTGGEQFITRPDNTSRAQTLPKAILNGFTAATCDGGNGKKQWAVEQGVLDWERIENWRSRSTHTMSVIGKRVAELLHGRPVRFSYFHGSSGGGRQALVEAQDWPEDYDGIWASCPAINWTKFLTEGYWPLAVMNDLKHVLIADRLERFSQAARDSVGGDAAFYAMCERVDFDPLMLVGTCGITKTDAEIMKQIWDGPHTESGDFLWYGFRPGVKFWNENIPIGGFYYQLLTHKPRPFFLCTHYLAWVREDEKIRSYNMSRKEFESFFRDGVSKFSSATADNAELSPYAARKGKLMIDHGTCDPLIPVDGTLDYYRKVCAALGGKEAVDHFLRLYITPGDGHGTCNWHGPGIPENEGMKALLDWVEQDIAPGALRTVQVDRRGLTLRESSQEPI